MVSRCGRGGMAELEAPAGQGRRVLIVVENLPVPFDRRVWLECQALRARGYEVSVICPQGPGGATGYYFRTARRWRSCDPPTCCSCRCTISRRAPAHG